MTENKKASINSKKQNKNDNRCFQYDLTVALNDQNIENNVERLTKFKSFID